MFATALSAAGRPAATPAPRGAAPARRLPDSPAATTSDQIPWIRSRSHISPPRMQSRRLLSSIARRPASELCAVALNLDFAALHAARSPPLE